MGAEKRKPLKCLAARREAGKNVVDGYLQNKLFAFPCQDFEPIPCIIRRIFIESLVSQRYTAKNSLRVDGLLILSEFLEGASYAFN